MCLFVVCFAREPGNKREGVLDGPGGLGKHCQ